MGFFLGVAGAVPWLWMAWMVLAGRGWARILSTVFFGIYFVSFVPETVISFLPGHFKTPANSFVVNFVGLEALFGLAAIILLWQRESSWFFLACKRARQGSRLTRLLGLTGGAGRGQLEPHPLVPPRSGLDSFTACMRNDVPTAPNRLLVLLAQIAAPQICYEFSSVAAPLA
jgi:hypothetical protein